MGAPIVHITTRSAWGLARSSGRYEPSSLAVDGFIHFSDVEQVVAIANAAFSRQGDLVLLCVAVDRLEAPLKYESSDAGGELFPHLYGALNLGAVVVVVPFVEDDDGFAVPAEVRSLLPQRVTAYDEAIATALIGAAALVGISRSTPAC